jgi:hypothetical protein
MRYDMHVSRDEFLLLMQNWKNSSASVIFTAAHGGSGSMPLSTALLVRVVGRVIGIDEEASFVSLLAGEEGVVSIGFLNAEFAFGTKLDLPASYPIIFPGDEEIQEIVTLRQSSGLLLSLVSLR